MWYYLRTVRTWQLVVRSKLLSELACFTYQYQCWLCGCAEEMLSEQILYYSRTVAPILILSQGGGLSTVALQLRMADHDVRTHACLVVVTSNCCYCTVPQPAVRSINDDSTICDSTVRGDTTYYSQRSDIFVRPRAHYCTSTSSSTTSKQQCVLQYTSMSEHQPSILLWYACSHARHGAGGGKKRQKSKAQSCSGVQYCSTLKYCKLPSSTQSINTVGTTIPILIIITITTVLLRNYRRNYRDIMHHTALTSDLLTLLQ